MSTWTLRVYIYMYVYIYIYMYIPVEQPSSCSQASCLERARLSTVQHDIGSQSRPDLEVSGN